MTKQAFHQPSLPSRSEPQSPENSQTGNSVEGFDNMSARSVDSTYPVPNHQRRSSSWTPASQYPEMMTPYNAQPRVSYQPQPGFSAPRASPSLPPIRDIDRVSAYEPTYPQPTNSYSQTYGTPTAAQVSQDHYSFVADRPPYYEPTHRYGQGYPQTNRPNAPQMDYARYAPSPYDYRTGAPYSSPYGASEYASSPTGPHPTSPTVAMDADTRNRRRRGNLPRQITDILRAWFHEHLDHPYPTEEDKQVFMARTGLSIAQVRQNNHLRQDVPLIDIVSAI
jgi:hypothetical protein